MPAKLLIVDTLLKNISVRRKGYIAFIIEGASVGSIFAIG